jgi:hypothetical protein
MDATMKTDLRAATGADARDPDGESASKDWRKFQAAANLRNALQAFLAERGIRNEMRDLWTAEQKSEYDVFVAELTAERDVILVEIDGG